MEKIILVIYVDVRGRSIANVREIMDKCRALFFNDNETTHYVIPFNGETRIDCVNPKLITKNQYKKVQEILDKNQKAIDDLILTLKTND